MFTVKHTKKYVETVGRRKTSTARVRISEGAEKSEIEVNGKKYDEYFKTENLHKIVEAPLAITGSSRYFTITVVAHGGGTSSQAGAVRHGIARALVDLDGTVKPEIKKEGLLTRDDRAKERRKFGRKGKARKGEQWSKR
jgi:small subunit ribosomal protein S9